MHVDGRDEPAHGPVHDPHPDEQQRDPVRLRGENLGAAEPERPLSPCRTGRKPRRDEGNGECGGVGEQMARVGEERERAGHDSRGDLGSHQSDDQRERSREQAAIMDARVIVAAVRVHHAAPASARPNASRSGGVGCVKSSR